MSVQTFVSTVWAVDLMENLNDAHVYANPMVVNREYEGDIKGHGSSVKINSIGRVTTRAYARNTVLAAPDVLDTADQILLIDTAQYFRFLIDNVDAVQAAGKFRANAMKEAAWAVAADIDTSISSHMQAQIDGSTNDLTNNTPLTVGVGAGESSMYGLAVRLKVALDKTNTPEVGRFLVCPPFCEGMMDLDERFVSFGTAGNVETLRGAPIKRAAGFTIFKSNQCPAGTGSSKVILAGYNGATTYAEQISEMDAFKHPDYFGDVVQELHVWGRKVTRPANLASAEVLEGSYEL